MNRPLRILCLSNMYPGPADPDYGAFVEAMCTALERQGHAVDRVVIDTRRRGAVATPAKYAGLARRAVPRARAADVIYAHYLFPTGAIAGICGSLARRPWVVTAHGGDVRNLASPAARRLSSPGISGAAALIAVSRYLAQELRTTGIHLPPVYVANMGVDLERFQPRDSVEARSRLGLDPGPLVLAVGGLTERKNPLRLLQAFARVRGERPGARLAFVGDGPLAGALRLGARRLGVEDAVVLAGSIPNSGVADWLAACDVLALPSLVEPLGIVALEAMASGRPVVATSVGGTAEVVGRAGTIVDPNDPHSIASGISRLLAHPPSPASCRAAAEAHGVARQATRIAEILRSAALGRDSLVR